MPVELALDHRSPYLVMVVGQPAAGADPAAVDDWFRDRGLGAAVGASFDPIAMHAGAPSDVPRDDATDRFLHLWFVDDDLPAVWEERFAGLGADFEAVRPRLARVRVTVPRHRAGHRHVHRPALVAVSRGS